ncbi:uncharacterized protein LOC108116938 [Drosophila eugracilis]|uniref:uncharacterized protein LOC108116938 n=1 Tax=Drosophila eugracilis TaxID=29029 RepID=UPI001BDB17AB|nr:uncharacterized protein LOC108116938 [Drosophila eugracilis]
MSRKFLQEFIVCLENEPAVWNAKCEAYKNKNLRNKAWEVLLEKYKEIDERATIDEVKKKVNSLRASYRREIRKIKRSEKSGAGTDDVYQPSLWYFSDLSFLYETESSVDGITSFDDGEENEIPKAPKRKHDESSESLQKAVTHLDNIREKQPKCEADIYAEGWAAMFKQLSKEQQLFAKKGIDELLMQGRMDMLTYQGVSSIANIPNKKKKKK